MRYIIIIMMMLGIASNVKAWTGYGASTCSKPVIYTKTFYAGSGNWWASNGWILHANGGLSPKPETGIAAPIYNYQIRSYMWNDEFNTWIMLASTAVNGRIDAAGPGKQVQNLDAEKATWGNCNACPAGERWTDSGCVPQCPSGESFIADPDRCVCTSPNVRLEDGTCGEKPDCTDEATACQNYCGDRGVQSFDCNVAMSNTGGQDVWNQRITKCNGDRTCCCTPLDCKDGTTYNAEEDVCECPVGQQKNAEDKCENIPCPQGQYRGTDGFCKEEPPDLTCKDNEQKNELGECVPIPDEHDCPEGTEWNEEAKECQEKPKDPTECAEGKERNDAGDCVYPDPSNTCPDGQVRQENGDCVNPAPTDKEGKTDYFKGQVVAGDGAANTHSWGVNSRVVDFTPIQTAAAAWENSSIMRSMNQLETIVNKYVSGGEAPVFNFKIGGRDLTIDLAIMNPVVEILRGMITLLIYFGLVMVIIRQWRML